MRKKWLLVGIFSIIFFVSIATNIYLLKSLPKETTFPFIEPITKIIFKTETICRSFQEQKNVNSVYNLACFNLVDGHARCSFEIDGKVITAVSSGHSNEPFFGNGDFVIIKETKDVQVGDVINFNSWEFGDAIHQLIKINETGYYTQGTNNCYSDIPISEDRIIGRVIAVFPDGVR